MGEFDPLSFSIRLNCTFAEYQRDFEYFDQEFFTKTHIKTLFHELTHYFQYVTTPVGQYISLLMNFQIIQIQHLVKNIPESHEVRYPLISLIEDYQSDPAFERVMYHYQYWFKAEIMIQYITCNFEGLRQLLSNLNPADLSLTSVFLDLESELCKINRLPFQRRAIKKENKPLHEFLAEILEFTSKAGNIFENHARMSEFWWDNGLTDNPFVNGNDFIEYAGLIHKYINTANTNSFDQFLSTFMAMCETAFFPPIMPYNAHISLSEETTIYDFNPLFRMKSMMKKSNDMKPVQNINDYNRFVNHMSAEMNYPSLREIIQSNIKHASFYDHSYIYDMFFASQNIRYDNFSTFFNYGLWHSKALTVEPFSNGFTKKFIPPHFVFLDTTKFHKDKDLSLGLYNKYCAFYYLRELLYGSQKNKDAHVYIKTPYPVDTLFDHEVVKTHFENLIMQMIGIIPNIRLYE